jgi:RND family efflux transporter MFP subunit
MRVRTLTLFLLVISLLSACAQPEPEPRPIRNLRTIVVGDISDIRNGQLPGRARSADEVDLSFDVSGTISERPVSIGSMVEKGELIARLDPRDFQANVRSTEADARTAKRNYERGSELLKTDFISEAEFDRLEARVDITQANLDLAKKALSDSEIYAPFSGVIVNLSVEKFQSIRAKSPIARLLGVDMVEMVVNVSESQITNVHQIEKIEVEFDALPGIRLPATITEIGREASLTTRTFPITLSMEQPEGANVLAGMAGTAYATATLSTEEASGYVIPVGALFGEATDNVSKVWVVDSNSTVHSREVRVGRVTPGGVQIVEGLAAGEKIATAGVHTLSEGQQVLVAGTEG